MTFFFFQDLTLLQGFCTWNSFKGIQYALAAFPQSYKEFSLLTKETALFQVSSFFFSFSFETFQFFSPLISLFFRLVEPEIL